MCTAFSFISYVNKSQLESNNTFNCRQKCDVYPLMLVILHISKWALKIIVRFFDDLVNLKPTTENCVFICEIQKDIKTT